MKRSSFLKIFLTGILLTVLLIKVDITEVVQIFLNLNPVYLMGALFLVPFLYYIRTVRWNKLLHALNITVPLPIAYKILLIGSFYGLVTPGRIGELGRAYHLNEKKVFTIPTVILEKFVDIFTLVILSLLTALFYFQNYSIIQITIFFFVIAVTIGLFSLTNDTLIFFMAGLFKVNPDQSNQFVRTINELLHNYPLMGYSFLLSLVYYGLSYVLGYLVILSAGFDPIVLITLPIIVLMGNIPITISGLGLRESIGSITFIYLGETGADGFVFAFTLFILITVIPGIFGYILMIKEN
jgi:glycosyltransferase 2 family protein